MMKGAEYSVNLADIPKEIRDRLGSSERDANWESSAGEGNMEYCKCKGIPFMITHAI